ncbi:hypothetical protein LSCM1_00662 [Leishmania martiniquensis]|uniref:Uncharacterized protein n=1 Tax=Leishmania martiniquensis TaxID=1580590 RepID=A0A836GUQ5_9TRYP|nr:hypothetical protein LSCM1_00662 [Leishmania martiniquensis]
MSFLHYVQSLWEASPSFSGRPPRGGNGASAQQLGSGVWPLSAQVQEEMKMGIRYNMKVVLRGARATGKSTLMARLSGHPLPARYTPSTELIASTMRLQGEHCATHEGTKVDVWEVVEECRQRLAASSSASAGTKMPIQIPTAQLHEALRVATDARQLDVYAGCELVIFMIDPRQRSSWEYAKQETFRVPPTTCILYALNFCDVGPFTAASGAVALDEVDSWCNRVRRATTSFLYRMLEGRQAPAEFSVRPMTAVLSAQTGAGMLGVMRALHVASTLVRIAAEEVRAQQLFTLLARQQAVPIVGGDSSHPRPAEAASAEGDCAEQAQMPVKMPPSGELRAAQRTPTPPPPMFDASAESASRAAARNSVRDAAQASPHLAVPIAAVKRRTTPGLQTDSGGLRMQHRSSTLVAAAGGERGCVEEDGKIANAHQTSLIRPMSDAEAMRIFLGGSDTGASGKSSSRSSSSRSASVAAYSGDGVAAKRRTVAHPLDAPSAALPAVHPGPERQARNDLAAASADTNSSEATPPPLLEQPHFSLPAPQSVRLLTEEMACCLVANMVHDVSVPADNFFAAEEAEGEDESSGAPSVSNPATPTSAAPPSGASGRRNVRMLTTQRVVQRESMPVSATAAALNDAFHADVSTILAQMTAALTADQPTATSERLYDDAMTRRVTKPDSALEGMLSARRKKKPRHLDSGNSEARGHHRHHRKTPPNGVNGHSAATAGEATEGEDNGSFDLVFV